MKGNVAKRKGGNSQAQATLDALINRSITEIESNVTSVGKHAFSYAGALISADFPSATSIGLSAFSDCQRLISADFPSATSIGLSAFYNCLQLTSVDFPSAISIGGNAFYSCSQLTSVEFPLATSIGEYAFNRCSQLTTFILRAKQVATLSNINAFNNTPFASGKSGGTLRVPQALISDYQNATNWSTILAYPNNQILPIEESAYNDSN